MINFNKEQLQEPLIFELNDFANKHQECGFHLYDDSDGHSEVTDSIDSDIGTDKSIYEGGSTGEMLSTESNNPKPYFIVSEFPTEVQPFKTFKVEVYLSLKQGETSSGKVFLNDNWKIDILVIPKSGFDLQGDYWQSVIVKKENLDKPLIFKLKSRESGKGRFIITARYQGTELFHQGYTVSIISADEKINHNNSTIRTLIKGKPAISPPDLTLLITQVNENGKLVLNYYLHSPDNTLNLNYKNFKVEIKQPDLGTYFLDFFNDIDDIIQDDKQQRLNAIDIMKQKGATLYQELFPEDLRRIFWSIHDKIKSIVINSDEPWIPWEICFMYSEDEDITTGMFLCETYEISRWISGSRSPESNISLANAAFVIPQSNLVYPPEEKNQLEGIFKTIKSQTIEIPATYKDVRQSFLDGNYTVWHFSGHGTDSQGTNVNHYRILLNDEDSFSPGDITGLKSIGNGKPIIFFNACQARPGLGLTGLSGWPKQFIDNKASAFIGTYWSVSDETACKLSVKFYELLASGEKIASALKKARLHVKGDGNLTWLAYTLYADPFAKITVQ